jgi:hypothetical protein
MSEPIDPVLADTTEVNNTIVETNPPVPLNKDDGLVINQSSINSLSTGIATSNTANTSITVSNNNRKHRCDAVVYAQQALYKAGAMGGQIVMAIRQAIKAILKTFGVSPGTSSITSYFKKIANYLQDIAKWMRDVNTFLQGFLLYAAKIQQIIAYILSLPKKLAKMFIQCLKEAYAELKAGYLSAVSDTTTQDATSSGLTDTLKEVQTQAKAVLAQTSTAISQLTKIAAIPAALVSGKTTTLTAAQEKQLNQSAFADYVPDPNKYKMA